MKHAVLVIAASDSDLPIISDAVKVLDAFGIPYQLTISSAHRSPERTIKLVNTFHKQGGKIIIASAGLAAHLAGSIAAHFPLPVIGIPLRGGALNGIDALYATVQMPPGIPVATVAINGAKNAGILAAQMLATGDKKLETKLIAYKKELADAIEEKAEKLSKLGLENFLSEKK